MATSRIVQATAAVQLFVQRCFLGLEAEVTVDASADGDWLQWQWMSQYRVWQANREVFLFPENWIDPTLRSDKSPFFAELQQDLIQGDLTAEVAEGALQNYLEKLEAVARLDVCGTFHDLESGQRDLRVLARSQGSPPEYYSASGWAPRPGPPGRRSTSTLPATTWFRSTGTAAYLFWAVVNVKAEPTGQPIPAARQVRLRRPGPTCTWRFSWPGASTSRASGRPSRPPRRPWSSSGPAWTSSQHHVEVTFNGDLLEIDVFAATVQQLRKADRGESRSRRRCTKAIDVNNPREHVGAYLLGGSGSGVSKRSCRPQTSSGLGDAGGPRSTDGRAALARTSSPTSSARRRQRSTATG